MSDDESVAEKVFEVGIEAINPGGRPDVLRAAAAGWRSLASEAEDMFSKLDREVKGTVGETWRGPAAEAFQNHWKQLKSAIDDTTGEFEECAKGLDEAAKSIEEINDEIHGIYAEIGISVAVSAATSLFSFGLSTAAGCRPCRAAGIEGGCGRRSFGRTAPAGGLDLPYSLRGPKREDCPRRSRQLGRRHGRRCGDQRSERQGPRVEDERPGWTRRRHLGNRRR